MGRVLAIDYGRRRVGIAISDPTGTIATGLETLVIKDTDDAITRIADGRATWEYDKIVVGLPLNTSGEHAPMTDEVLAFVESLRERCGVTVETIDERYSSAEATRMFYEMGKRTKGNKGHIDRLAAEVILRQYLDSQPGGLDVNEG